MTSRHPHNSPHGTTHASPSQPAMLRVGVVQASMLLSPTRGLAGLAAASSSSSSSFLHPGSSSSSSRRTSHPTLQQVRQKHRAYEAHFLQARKANYQPLSPLSFLERTAKLYPRRTAVAYRDETRTWAEEHLRIKKLGSSLYKAGVRPGDTVSVMCLNTPPILETHFAVPGIRAVLNTLNTRLDAPIIAFQLQHGDSKVLITDTEHSETVEAALQILDKEGVPRPLVIDIIDKHFLGKGKRLGKWEFEEFLAQGDDVFELQGPEDEFEAIALNYTSGTTGDPKGVVSHHRGAYLNSLANIISWGAGVPQHAVFLHIVPMFHCNGWCFPWAITALAGTHVCTRWVRADLLYEAMDVHRVTHFCGAPILMTLLLNATQEHKRDLHGRNIQLMTAGAPPPPSLIRALKREVGIEASTAYGLTETYGPTTVYIEEHADEYPGIEGQALDSQLQWQAQNVCMEDVIVADPETLLPVPADGETQGEVFMRGNTVMSGYLKNESATEATFAGGWLHTGDIAVAHKNGRIQIKDRSKDVIISGGENISSIEVENALHLHPSIAEVAVVAKPCDKWGEVPCAFVSLKDGHVLTEQEAIAFSRQHLAHYKAPKRIIFGPLPKTSTGKVQKYQLRNVAKESGPH